MTATGAVGSIDELRSAVQEMIARDTDDLGVLGQIQEKLARLPVEDEPVVKAAAVGISLAPLLLRGEEVAIADPPLVRNALSSIDAILSAVITNDSEACDTNLTALYDSLRSIPQHEAEAAERDSTEFRDDLRESVEIMGKAPGEARALLSKWRRHWRDGKKLLPPADLEIGFAAVSVVLRLFGDPVEWTQPRHHKEDLETAATLLKKTVSVMEKASSEPRLDLLAEEYDWLFG